MISIRKNYTVPTFVRIGVSILSASALASCGGGGGDAGTTNASAIANRYNVSLVTRPATSVFYGGSNTTAYVTLTKTCATASTTSTTSTTSATSNACGSMPLDSVAGQVVTLKSSNPAAVTFTPSIAVTDSEGNAQINISSA